jgi:L-amino acid N-acyltransferase
LRHAPLLCTGVSTTPSGSADSGPAASPRPVTVDVRLATLDDAAAILAIYNFEVENHTSTFDLVARTLDDQRRWISERSGAFSAVVASIDDEVVGFASLSPYKERPAYRTTVEDSVYVSREHPRLGIGRTLMEHVIGIAADSGFHSIVARIEATGTASRELHAACGFELVGVEREVGRKFNRWLDVAVMQLML